MSDAKSADDETIDDALRRVSGPLSYTSVGSPDVGVALVGDAEIRLAPDSEDTLFVWVHGGSLSEIAREIGSRKFEGRERVVMAYVPRDEPAVRVRKLDSEKLQ